VEGYGYSTSPGREKLRERGKGDFATEGGGGGGGWCGESVTSLKPEEEGPTYSRGGFLAGERFPEST